MRLNKLIIFLTHSNSQRRFTYGKPTVNAAAQAPGIGDFTITIGDHDIIGNPINDTPRD
jgi:hypothetical protein